ncbi:MAG: hypothetical protein JWN51_2069 [Phycisphaerales bacterium]|nr:hypothetical protein [Phycisphaerales bacterium]
MSHSSDSTTRTDDRTQFAGGGKLFKIGATMAVAGLGLALIMGFGGPTPFRRFLFSYLVALAYFLSLALGSLAFVLLQHLTRSGWSVGVRRVAENIASTLPALGVLAIPIVLSVMMGNGYLYRWAIPENAERSIPGAHEAAAKGEDEVPPAPAAKSAGAPKQIIQEEAVESTDRPENPRDFKLDALTLMKRDFGLHWLNPWFFILRVVVYFLVWSGIAVWYRKQSILQDKTGDANITLAMQARSAPALVALGLTLTFGAFDLLMSLDPHWYSTIFGAYYFAGCAVASYALLTLIVFLLQRSGYLRDSINIEHYHDLGKYMFAFTFFYGYIAFSQYMLLWYANLPETTAWMARHGASTAHPNAFSGVIVTILFCKILVPFAAILSRHVKRARGVLAFWAVWILVFQFVDMYWIVMPELRGVGLSPRPADLACLVGVGGVFLAVLSRKMSAASLRPMADPRLPETLAHVNAY